MTVSSTPRKAGPYIGNGVTTVFPFSFKVFEASDVAAVLTDSTTGTATNLILNSDYSVLLNPNQDANPGGSVTYPILVGPSPMPSTSTLTMIGALDYDQETDITNAGRFLPQVIENALDKLTILAQQLKEISGRTLQAAVGTTVALLFPPPSSGKFIRWRTDLLGLENADAGTDSMALQGLLADAGDVTHGSAMVGFKPSATSATGRTLSAKLGETLSVKDFGAVGNGVADDTAALQAAINWCSANNFQLYIPGGTYKYSSLTITNGITIRGDGRYKTYLRTTRLTADAISVNTPFALNISGITFATAAGTPSAGACIRITSTAVGTVNQFSTFRDCSFDGLFDCIYTVKAMTWVIDNCVFTGYIGTAVHVQNDDNGDGGDSTIHGGCIFNGVGPSSIAVFQVSSGGLKFVGNKVVGGAYGYLMQLGHLVQTGVLVIAGNSFENLTVSGIQMNRAVGIVDMHFTNVTITGNEFLGTATGIPINLNDTDNTWLLGVTITGNVIDCSHAGCPPYGIYLLAVYSFTITGNVLIGVAGPYIGIGIGASAVDGFVGGNVTSGYGAAITNLSAQTAIGKKVLQGKTTGINCSTAVGSLFKGSAAISFPSGFFGSVPNVFLTVLGGTSGVSAFCAGAATSGATLTAVSAVTGENVVVQWSAEADY